MRLTLRTLLAYLDNTLEPADAEAIRQKLSESGFATQLVQRIRSTLGDAGLPVMPPNAVNPIQESNLMGEYLDSTLSAEQEAEIEKVCLASDTHLAEAAACHQILTMVLGKQANFTDELRERIYQLPDREIEKIPASGSFSSVAVPAQDSITGVPESPNGESVLTASPAKVPPVGVGDSGVSDAPARLRDSGTLHDPEDEAYASRVGASDMYTESSFSASTLTPWLVSFSLAGLLIFALAKIFGPVISGTLAQNNSRPTPALKQDFDIGETIVVPESETPATEDAERNQEQLSQGLADDPTAETVASADVNAASADVPDEPESTDEVMSDTSDPPVDSPPAGKDGKDVTNEAEPMPKESITITDADSTEAKPSPLPTDNPAGTSLEEKSNMVAATDVDPPAGKDLIDRPVAGAPVALAKFATENSLIVARGENESWSRIGKDAVVSQLATIMNMPKFESKFEVADQMSVTFAGLTKVAFTKPEFDGQASGLSVAYGRTLIDSKKPDVKFDVRLTDQKAVQVTIDEKTRVIIEVIQSRLPGYDPFIKKNHIPISRIATLKGKAWVKSDSGMIELEPGKQWMVRDNDAPKVLDIPSIPAWANPKVDDDSVLDESARDGLLALIDEQPNLSDALRNATTFRKSEVAALAGQSMLAMGIADVYFGSDGLLSETKQRAFWPDHFRSLRGSTNLSTELAKQIYEEIKKMDSANLKPIFRLLTGYSQNQLIEGSDEDIVELLDSDSMAVRVLAIENLREITGATLNFRPEEDSAKRRVSAIKKWQARLRKSDIRRSGGGVAGKN